MRFATPEVTLTSKVIDGTFPDYARVIPTGNAKRLEVDAAEFAQAVDRVATVSSERSRAVKMALEEDRLVLSVNAPDSGRGRRGAGRRLWRRAAGDRLQRQVPAGDRRPGRPRERGLPVQLRRRPDADARGQRRDRGLCRDADAGLTPRRVPVGTDEEWIERADARARSFSSQIGWVSCRHEIHRGRNAGPAGRLAVTAPLAVTRLGCRTSARTAAPASRSTAARSRSSGRTAPARPTSSRRSRCSPPGAACAARAPRSWPAPPRRSAGRSTAALEAPGRRPRVATWSEGAGRRVEIDGKPAPQAALGARRPGPLADAGDGPAVDGGARPSGGASSTA